jgi:hypothetical protein
MDDIAKHVGSADVHVFGNVAIPGGDVFSHGLTSGHPAYLDYSARS